MIQKSNLKTQMARFSVVSTTPDFPWLFTFYVTEQRGLVVLSCVVIHSNVDLYIFV